MREDAQCLSLLVNAEQRTVATRHNSEPNTEEKYHAWSGRVGVR